MRFIGNTGAYFLSNILNKAIPFLLLPVLTRYLDPKDYGILANYYVVSGFAVVLIGLNTNGALMVQYFKLDREYLRSYTGNIMIILLVSIGLWCIVSAIGERVIQDYFKFNILWMWAVIAAAFGQSVIALVLVLWQARGKAWFYGLFNVLNTLANVAISLLLVIIYGWHWEGRVTGIVIATGVFCMAGLYVMKRNSDFTFSIDKRHLKHILQFGIPLLPHALSGVVISGVDKLFISNMVGLKETGIYSVGSQIGTIISIFGISFNTAWSPYLFGKLKNPSLGDKRLIVLQTYMLCAALMILAVSVSLLAPLVLPFLVSHEFQNCGPYVRWISLGYAFSGVYLVLSNYIFYMDKTYILSAITLSCGCVNLILNYVLIRINGASGAAQAFLITYVCFALATWILSQKMYPMPWISFWRQR